MGYHASPWQQSCEVGAIIIAIYNEVIEAQRDGVICPSHRAGGMTLIVFYASEPIGCA